MSRPNQSFVPPSNSNMEPPANQFADQSAGNYGAQPITSTAPQPAMTGSTYVPVPSASNSQYPTPNLAPAGSTSMAPNSYQQYGYVGVSSMPMSMNPTFDYNHQQNGKRCPGKKRRAEKTNPFGANVIPNAPMVPQQQNQWSGQENNGGISVYASQSYNTTTQTQVNSDPVQQNQFASTTQYTMYPNMGSPSQILDAMTGPSSPMNQNGIPAELNGTSTVNPPAGAPQNSRSSSRSTGCQRTLRSRNRDKAVLKWRPGMKERKITDDMTPEEIKEATDYNMKLAEAKKSHTREQNRVSAQKSRQKKVELLNRTKSQVDHLEEDNVQLQSNVSRLEAVVQSLQNDNSQLRSHNEILRQRIAFLEQQVQTQPVRNPHVALPALANQSQPQSQINTPTLAPGMAGAQNYMQASTSVQRHNPTPAQSVPRGQMGQMSLDNNGLSSTQAVNNGSAEANQQPQQMQQPDNLVLGNEGDYIIEWLEMSTNDYPPPTDPNNGGVQ
ncbi:hypothetical protein F5B19DRAFT_491239 [Rostrohypoxylon terebratum]|nr:hypothetical protein F5B19DRAFT_491239 [Rostrohypoxylon terebratum]